MSTTLPNTENFMTAAAITRRNRPACLRHTSSMHKLKVFIAESVTHEDFYNRDWEGHAAEEIIRLLDGRTRYRMILNKTLLRRAIKEAATVITVFSIFHVMVMKTGVQLSGNRDVSWQELAEYFQKAKSAPEALVLSSCAGGDAGIARAFEQLDRRPTVIFGAEATKEDDLITLPSACISWSILYSVLATEGMTPDAFKEAVTKMNKVTPHQFVYRRWDDKGYRRYPRAAS
jgi:hypothetical protein